MDFLAVDTVLSVCTFALAFLAPNLGSRWFAALEQSFGKLARKRGLSVLVVGLSALALRAALLPIQPVPHPLIMDEFAYLLSADTFAHGRLTNPIPPLWTHFESLFIIMQPTYNSKYPPGQSFFLALGQVIGGHPFWGVWLSCGLMCAAICWMLQAWFSEGWALLGGFLAVARLAAFSYWADSYWGGAVPALAGALVLGALPRLKGNLRIRYALLMGLGLAILANSRPYEGLVFSLPVAVALFAWMLGKHRPAFSISLRKVVLPLSLLLGLTGAWMGYYNWRVTGNPLKMPYQVYQAQYDPTPYFLWQSEKPLPQYRHPVMKEWETDIDLRLFRDTRTVRGLLTEELEKIMFMWVFFVGPLVSLLIVFAFLTLPYGFTWRDITGPTKFLLVAFGTSLAGIGLEAYFYPQYTAPMTCLFIALIMLAMRHLRPHRWRGKPTGLFLVRSVPALMLLLMLLRVGASPLHLYETYGLSAWFSHMSKTSTAGRRPIIAELNRRPGRHLVLVRYSPNLYNLDLHKDEMWPPSGVWEWVYNGADIDAQRVVWAHDMGPAKNQELINYYKDRDVWLLEADEQPPRLEPYADLGSGAGPPGKEKTARPSQQSVK